MIILIPAARLSPRRVHLRALPGREPTCAQRVARRRRVVASNSSQSWFANVAGIMARVTQAGYNRETSPRGSRRLRTTRAVFGGTGAKGAS